MTSFGAGSIGPGGPRSQPCGLHGAGRILLRMFTGLVQAIGRVDRVSPVDHGAELLIRPLGWSHRAAVGESVSVSGVCLTVADDPRPDGSGDAVLRFNVVKQTLDRTTLGLLRPGDHVNLEHACRPDTLLGGHFVQGHVDGVGVVRAAKAEASDYRLTVAPPADLLPFIVPRGSIALDGVSLTIAEVGPDTFEVVLVPTTLEKTTLSRLRPGSRLNIETDIIVRTVVHALRSKA